MSIVKVIEVISEGNTVEDAIKSAVAETAKTIENIKQVNVDYIEGVVENNKISKYRINAKVSFVVKNH